MRNPMSLWPPAACYISTVEQWTEFKRNWKEVDDRERFGVFHMADFVGRKKQFELFESPECCRQFAFPRNTSIH
jgi:hypothetical protein